MADQFDGMGGSYVVESGKRRLVHNTQDHPDGNRAREALSEQTQGRASSGAPQASSALSGGTASGQAALAKTNGGE